ncbi:two-component system sensor histidine kinase VicK [Pedobacter sp. UYEF25]
MGNDEAAIKKLQQANKDLDFHIEERENRAAELVIANKELVFQKQEKKNRAAELAVANKELVFQNQEKEKRAAELVIANKELVFQNQEKEKRAAELIIANEELVFQNQEKENRAAELIIANKELVFQNQEKENRAVELVIANKELVFQNQEKEKRAAELIIANKELVFQNQEKENRAAELVITNKKLASSHKKIEESEERFRNVVEQSLNPILILKGEDLKLELANEPLFKVWNVGKEALGKPFLEILPEMKGQPFEGLLLDVLRNGVTHYGNEQPAYFVRENGEAQTFYFNFVYLPYRESDGSISGIMVQAYDVSMQVMARKKIEENEIRFRSIMETISQIAWTFTVEAGATFFNKHWYDYTGLDKEQSKAGGWYAVIHPDDSEQTLKKLRFMRDDNSLDMNCEIRFKRTDGKYRWHLVNILPIKNKHSEEVQLWTGIATDIHDLKILQEQKDDFISIASHELKTPITTLTASLQLLNRMKDNPSAKIFPNLIERANKSVDKVNVLIEDLLNLTRFNQGQLHLNKKRIRISELIENCCQPITSEGVFIIKNESDDQLEICADPGRIEQVIINFMNNAIKYAPNSKEILITVKKLNDQAKVSVTDKGAGIPADKIPHLFDRYFRVDSSVKQYSGLGLGLYISREIIRNHEGEIGVDSKVGKGSTFWFTLPLSK